MAPISLADTLEIELGSGGVEFSCSDPSLADAKENLVTRAARLFLEEFKLETGVRVHLEKRIPVGAGLGGRKQRCGGHAAGLEAADQN